MLKIDVGTYIADKYLICAKIGSGANGAVYLAQDPDLNRQVAIKVLHIISSESASVTQMRFEREARVLSQLVHENIVRVYFFGTLEDGRPYLVMEYVEGESLRSIIEKRTNLACNEAVQIAVQICSAIQYAHSQQIIHRDLKPDNVIVKQSEAGFSAKVLDFGLCRQDGQGTENIATLTETGFALGTACYMSPEQCTGKGVDWRTDIYSFGCVFFEMITGRPPFVDLTPAQILLKQISEPAPKLLELSPKSGLPELLQNVIVKCLAKDKESRYQHFSELKSDLLELGKINSRAKFSGIQLKKTASHGLVWIERSAKSLVLAALLSLLLLIIWCSSTIQGAVWAAIQIQSAALPSDAVDMLSNGVGWLVKNGHKQTAESIVKATIDSRGYRLWSALDRESLLNNYLTIFREEKDSSHVFLLSVQLLRELMESITRQEKNRQAVNLQETHLLETVCQSLIKTPDDSKKWHEISLALSSLPEPNSRNCYMLWPSLLNIETMKKQTILSTDRLHGLAEQSIYASKLARRCKQQKIMRDCCALSIKICKANGFLKLEERQHAILGLDHLENGDLEKARRELAEAEPLAKQLLLSSGDTHLFQQLKEGCSEGRYISDREYKERHPDAERGDSILLQFVK